MKHVFALVDCNNFYASCEKLFRPDLKHKPVVVLSNNDGCVIARSQEVKALGLKMGAPLFSIREQIRRHHITCFSSNYALYADMSNRVMNLLEQEAPNVEIYSIDEAFLELTGVESLKDYESFARNMKQKIDSWTGITVGVGIAPTKTLAKLANHAAKTYPATKGVVDLLATHRQRKLMSLVDVKEVWGVGRRLSEKLRTMGIHTALDLADSDPRELKRQFSIVLERTIHELNGTSCLELENIPTTKKQIICSRSFGHRITLKSELGEAIAEYVSRAAEKLREEKQLAKVIQVFIRTGGFNPNEPAYNKALSIELTYPTNDTRTLLAAANSLFEKIFQPGFRYAKAGVMLSDFYASNRLQEDLFHNTPPSGASKLMQVIDTINQSGLGNVFFAAQGVTPQWSMKREYLSPAYTTKWKDIPSVW
ncbi:translesion error-prone DNA polymerase V subunit UmuC [Marinomonas epiphytica]